MPGKVWLYELGLAFYNISRHTVRSNCGSSFQSDALYTHTPLFLFLKQTCDIWKRNGIQVVSSWRIQLFFTANSLFWGLNKYQNKLFAFRNTPLCYLWHLRYISNYTLRNHLKSSQMGNDRSPWSQHNVWRHHNRILLRSNPSEILWMSLLTARMKKIHWKMRVLDRSQGFSHYKSMGIFPDAQGQLIISLSSDTAQFRTHPRFYGCPSYRQEPLKNRGTRLVTRFLPL